jgi:hypothetical protein
MERNDDDKYDDDDDDGTAGIFEYSVFTATFHLFSTATVMQNIL